MRSALDQVIVDVDVASTSMMPPNFEKFRKEVRLFVNISPHHVLLDPLRIRIFVDAKLFEESWNSSGLEYVLGKAAGNAAATRATVLTRVCKYEDSNPCPENSLCLVRRDRYDFSCICKFGFSNSSNHLGLVCSRRRLCLDEGTDSPATSGCECPAYFAGEYCQINVSRLALTTLMLGIMVLMILRNLRDCLSNFKRQPRQATKVEAIIDEIVEDGQIKRKTTYSHIHKRSVIV
ncbi:uncharacterized protein LOC100909227 [Galendromus occidentalis]|uniref:Uncharacterized protein LOC100909227 n=1 Tax=Galendromus occidentalis TaxID=34638 RepID=A0AAJ6QVJ9_9ACAR|nr:uncharacterized protein LOC100909227 [Galendromus occidentalis]